MAESKDAKKYGKLLGKIDYDHEAVDQLAAALNEITTLEQRATQLKQIVEENRELHQFVWRTSDNRAIAIHALENDHLTNVMQHLLNTGRPIPRAIRGEAITRGINIPVTPNIETTASLRQAMKLIGMADREDLM